MVLLQFEVSVFYLFGHHSSASARLQTLLHFSARSFCHQRNRVEWGQPQGTRCDRENSRPVKDGLANGNMVSPGSRLLVLQTSAFKGIMLKIGDTPKPTNTESAGGLCTMYLLHWLCIDIHQENGERMILQLPGSNPLTIPIEGVVESPSRRVPGFPSLVAPRFDDLKVAGTRAELEILCYFDQWTPHGILDNSPIVWFSHGRSMSEQLIFSWGNCCQLFCNSEEGGYWFHMSKYDFTVDGILISVGAYTIYL